MEPAAPPASVAQPDPTTPPFIPPPAAAAAVTLEADEGDVHGRIGYGRVARFSPLLLALLLLAALALVQYGWPSQPETAIRPAALAGQVAPDVSLTLLDGSVLRLAELRGSVVVLNFWASWCEPCREEMPTMQAASDAARAAGDPVVIVGVGVRTDHEVRARELVAQLGLSYPIGRDTAIAGPGLGPIQRAFGVPEAYPATIFIRPDGTVGDYYLGPLTADQLRHAIGEAAS